MKHYGIYITEKILKFLQLQLFISLLSFPILAVWGLPISIMALVGNLVFTPWVILFVAVSTLIFFTELLDIPNDSLIVVLEYVTQTWYYCLSWGKKSWVIGIPHVMIPYISMLAGCALLIICHKRWGQLIESTMLLIVLYGSFFAVWYWMTPVSTITSLKKGKSELVLISGGGKIMLYDNNYLKKIRSADSWVEYTLIPFLVKNTGTIVVESVCVHEFSPHIIPTLLSLMEYAQVKIIKIPYFAEQLTSDQWHQFFKLHEIAKNEGTKIQRIYPDISLSRYMPETI